MLRGVIATALVAGALLVPTLALASNAGLVFRANGFYKGEEDISDDQIQCEVPVVGNAIVDGNYQMGMWLTFGSHTISFPNRNLSFANPCGGWIQLQNNMMGSGINVTRVDLKYKVRGLSGLRGAVPTRKGFPLACRELRTQKIFAGTRLEPIGSENQPSGSGQPNIAFVQLLPMVSAQVFRCLWEQYATLPPDQFTSLQLLIKARARGVADNGNKYQTNTINYTLNLRHLCGNARIDDGEECDANPAAPNTCILGACEEGFCADSPIPCFSDQDCIGSCTPQGVPTECTCIYGQ
jgi:hypothetical protein